MPDKMTSIDAFGIPLKIHLSPQRMVGSREIARAALITDAYLRRRSDGVFEDDTARMTASLGKLVTALHSPAESVNPLAKLGVTFTEEQKAIIKGL